MVVDLAAALLVAQAVRNHARFGNFVPQKGFQVELAESMIFDRALAAQDATAARSELAGKTWDRYGHGRAIISFR